MLTLVGHNSPDTAFIQNDYPYTFQHRCTRLVWLEYKKGHGYRMVTQTSNPKKPGLVWNKPKAGIYHPLAVLYLDADTHVQIDALRGRGWDSVADIEAFQARHAAAFRADPHAGPILGFMRAYAQAYEARQAATAASQA